MQNYFKILSSVSEICPGIIFDLDLWTTDLARVWDTPSHQGKLFQNTSIIDRYARDKVLFFDFYLWPWHFKVIQKIACDTPYHQGYDYLSEDFRIIQSMWKIYPWQGIVTLNFDLYLWPWPFMYRPASCMWHTISSW